MKKKKKRTFNSFFLSSSSRKRIESLVREHGGLQRESLQLCHQVDKRVSPRGHLLQVVHSVSLLSPVVALILEVAGSGTGPDDDVTRLSGKEVLRGWWLGNGKSHLEFKYHLFTVNNHISGQWPKMMMISIDHQDVHLSIAN